MPDKKIGAVKSATTGSYTIPVHKSARTGRFASKPSTSGKIIMATSGKKSSAK